MKFFLFSFLLIIFLFQASYSQEQDSQQPANQNQPTVIDLTELGKTYTISARMELPQVRMFEKRINPDFKKLSAEKSFTDELSPEAEGIKYEPITSGKVKNIDNVEALLKKKRF
jgi:hypothetical protein